MLKRLQSFGVWRSLTGAISVRSRFILCGVLSICLTSFGVLFAYSVNLTWDEVGIENEGYRIYQRPDPGIYDDYGIPVWEGLLPPATIENLVEGENYCWICRAVYEDGESGDSNEICTTGRVTTPTTGFAYTWEEIPESESEYEVIWIGGQPVVKKKGDPGPIGGPFRYGGF